MSYFYLIKFDFGTSIASIISEDYINNYQKCFSIILGKRFSLRTNIKKCKTIPISDHSAQFASYFIEKFKNTMIKYYGLMNNNTLKDEDSLVIIDVRGIIRSLNLLPFTNEIVSILQNDREENKFTRFALIVDSVKENKFLGPILPYIIKKKVCAIDSEKRFLFGGDQPVFKSEFPIENITESPIEKIRYKLIKRIGHYARPLSGKHESCNQFFYDATYCIDEIKEIIFRKIVDFKKDNSFSTNTIIYHCPESQWLADALYKVDSALHRLKQIYDIKYSKMFALSDLKDRTDNRMNILFIVPLIQTEKTFKEKYIEIRKLFPNSNIHSISILYSGDPKLKGNIKEIFIKKHGAIKVDFFLNVDQISYSVANNNCPMCKYDLIPKEHSPTEIKDYLTSYEMWLICDSVGYKKEDFPPSAKRKLIKVMPDSLKAIKDNAPFLAYKFNNLLSINNLNKSSDLIFVYPDETSNKRELKKRNKRKMHILDKPSGYFAESLRQLMHYQCFSIPREIISNILDGKMKLTEIKIRYPIFFKNLKQLPEDIIILDEVNVGGGTVSTIVEILRNIGKEPLAYFPIINFSPQKEIPNLKDIKMLSLYQFDYSLATIHE